MAPKAIERAADILLAARRHRRPIDGLPEGLSPNSIDDAYAVQDRLVRMMALPVVGWKIGCTSREAQALLGIDHPIAGRVVDGFLFDSPAVLSSAEYLMRGVEAEFAFRLAVDLPPGAAPFGRDQVLAAVDHLYPAIEIIDPAFAEAAWTRVGTASIIADNSAHGALVLGAPRDDWRDRDLARAPVELRINGEVRGAGSGASVLGHPLQALAWLATDRARRGDGLEAGQIVTTGTCTGFHMLRPGDRAIADFADLGQVELRFTR
ncbi:MAG: 2-keto-4-pentenoate hydratase [Kiloniellales bacterium]